jgi:hypothetical protein
VNRLEKEAMAFKPMDEALAVGDENMGDLCPDAYREAADRPLLTREAEVRNSVNFS